MHRALKIILTWISHISFALMIALVLLGYLHELIGPGPYEQLMHAIGLPFSLPLHWAVGGISIAIYFAAIAVRDKIKCK